MCMVRGGGTHGYHQHGLYNGVEKPCHELSLDLGKGPLSIEIKFKILNCL